MDENRCQVDSLMILIDFRKTTPSAFWHQRKQIAKRLRHEMTYRVRKRSVNSLWPHRYALRLWYVLCIETMERSDQTCL